MDEQRPAQQWIVKVNGVEDVRLDPGESLEIGRKPLRPLADVGVRRLDVPDQTKSMSKRHATFAVTEQGGGVLCDLNSTNGTYVVRDDGELMRIPAGVDFPLPGSTVRFQFGDVPVDFLRVDVPTEPEEPAEAVPDLFSYASGGVQEPDAADMSVDDILDLRAGEPTSAFNAQSVRNRVGALRQDQPVQPVQPMPQPVQEPAAATPESSFAQPSAAVTTPEPAAPIHTAPEHVAHADLPIIQAGIVAQPTAAPIDAQPAAQPRNLFADAIDGGAAQTPAGASPAQSAQPAVQSAYQPYQAQQPYQPAESQPAAQPIAQPIVQQPANQYQPAFEPGSVFERVSRGDFEAKQPAIEAGGHTSEQAKITRDFAVQFDMARYPQLLPFLAMNPALYDDLYAWLSALGDKDIDAALENNEGYRDYLAAMGK